MFSCSTTKTLTTPLSFSQTLDLEIDTCSALKAGFTGVFIADLDTKEVIYSRNADKFFVPASNTKIFTLQSCLTSLGDSIPALRYIETDSTFTFWGTGDPTFLHPFFPASRTLEFLQSKAVVKKMYISYAHSDIGPFGEGWMWDDYNGSYQPELSSFPIYGNVFTIKKDSNGLQSLPDMLMSRTILSPHRKSVRRHMDYNLFEIPSLLDTVKNYFQEIPYKNAESTNKEILEKLLSTKIEISTDRIPKDAKTLYSLHKDTVLRRMMQISDNMLAEQLLLLSGMAVGDSISSRYAISMAKERSMTILDPLPKWVDGSGLSRYNMMTPKSIYQLLYAMYQTNKEDQLFSYMSIGGVVGTIKSVFKYDDTPYVFAKSGTLGGSYNLSGYLIAKSGKRYIFSFMNNNLVTPSSKIRLEVERILNKVREK